MVVPSDQFAEQEELDHGVLIVGWDDTKLQGDGQPGSSDHIGAWRVKNSYGNGWGDSGHFWIGYGGAGIGSAVSKYPLDAIKDNDPVLEYRLANDGGWAGETAQIGPYVINRFEGPRDGTLVVESLDIAAGMGGVRCMIKVYEDFDTGIANGPMGLVIKETSITCPLVGLYNVPLPGDPIELASGDQIFVQMEWVRADTGFRAETVAVAPPYLSITGSTLVTEDQKEMWDVTKIGGYLFAGGSDGYLIDVANPDAPSLRTLLEREGDVIRNVVPISDRLVLCQTGSTGQAGDVVTNSLPFVIYDFYSVGSWREVALPIAFDQSLDHPDLPAAYGDQSRATFDSIAFASRGNELFMLANRLQARYSAADYRWRYWGDLGLFQWNLSDPYNPTLVDEQVYRQDAAVVSIAPAQTTQWPTDPDLSGDLGFGFDLDTSFNDPAGDLFGFGYRIDLAGDGAATFVQAVDPQGTGPLPQDGGQGLG